MNDTLCYFRRDTQFRRESYHKLTFSMFYFKNERYLLPLSHDEVVHGKGTILQKMFGSMEDKLAQVRCLYLYMYAHPGKKLNFMGNELAQTREWNETRQQDWQLLQDPVHAGFHQFMNHLNRVYADHDSLWAKDYEEEGFCWLDCHQEQRCIYAMERRSDNERILALFNFSDTDHHGYGLNVQGQLLEPLCFTDCKGYSGAGEKASVSISNGWTNFDLPRFSACLYLIKE